MDYVPKIRAEWLLEKEGSPKASSSKQDALGWIGRADKAGMLAQTSAKEAIFGKSPLASISSTSKAAYLKEIFDVSKAKDTIFRHILLLPTCKIASSPHSFMTIIDVLSS